MELHEALYTTRAMRRVKSDPIPHDVQARILDAAIRAPSGGNQQNWRFLLLDDPAKKAALAPLYQHATGQLWETIYKAQIDAAHASPDSAESKQMLRIQRSAQWLADHFEEVPLFLFPFCQYDPTGGSIYPAVWSAMLAARAANVRGGEHESLATTVAAVAGEEDEDGAAGGVVLSRWRLGRHRRLHGVRGGWADRTCGQTQRV